MKFSLNTLNYHIFLKNAQDYEQSWMLPKAELSLYKKYQLICTKGDKYQTYFTTNWENFAYYITDFQTFISEIYLTQNTTQLAMSLLQKKVK